MRTTMMLAAVAALSITTPAIAGDPIDGTWVVDVKAITQTGKPDGFLLKDGKFTCSTCTPPYAVAADGQFHAVKDRPYWDETAIRIVDDRTVAFSYKKAGKVIATSTETVTADGSTLASVSNNTNNGNGAPIDVTSSSKRVGSPVAGAHLVSGEWQVAPPTTVSDAATRMTMKVDGDTFMLTSPLGETLRAKIGGDYATVVGDPGKTMTKVERVGPAAMKLTDMRMGKITSVSTYTVTDDGKTLMGQFTNPLSGQSGTFKAAKQ